MRRFPTANVSWADLSKRCVARKETQTIFRSEFTSPWWKDYSPDACAFHQNIWNWSNQKIGTIVRSIDISVWYDYWYFHRSEIWNVCIFAKRLEAIWYAISRHRYSQSKFFSTIKRWYRKRKELKNACFLRNKLRAASIWAIARNRDEDVGFQWRSSSVTKIVALFPRFSIKVVRAMIWNAIRDKKTTYCNRCRRLSSRNRVSRRR